MEKGFIQEVVDQATEIIAGIIGQLVEIVGVFGEPVSAKRQLDAYKQLKGLPDQQKYAALFYMVQTYGQKEVEDWIKTMEGRIERSRVQTVRPFEDVLNAQTVRGVSDVT